MWRWLVLMFITILLAFFLAMSVRAENRPIPNLDNLMGPPEIIEHQGVPHAVFNLGGVYFLYKVTHAVVSFPQCNALQTKGHEIMVVGNNPKGYLFFVEEKPVAFKTDHNPKWTDLIKRTFENGA